jgi:hypothetical protein
MTSTDVWGVWQDIDAFRAKARHEPFAGWTDSFLADKRKRIAEPGQMLADGAEGLRACAESARESAFAYLLTGEDVFARHARAGLLKAVESPSSWVSAGHAQMYPDSHADLLTAEITKCCATLLGWLSPVLDPADAQGVVSAMAERGGGAIYTDACAGAWWANALNSNWTAVLNGGLMYAGLVLREADAETAATWISFARDRLIEMLDLAAEEGAGVEGPGYWLYCFGSIQDAAEALRNAAGEDLFSHPFWARCSRFLPYLALPDFSAWVNYADTAYKGIGGSAFFHGVAARARDGFAQWFGDRIMSEHGGPTWKDLVYYDGTVAPQPIDTEPCCRFFSSIHLASFRSGWENDAVFCLFKGGSNAWSHTHLDLNSFFITAYGDRLATEPGPAPYSLHYWHSIEPPVSTAWHNCIVVDGGHQRVAAQYAMSYDLEEAGDCYSRFDAYLDSDSIATIRGDASTAYGDTLSRAWRRIVYLKPDVFVIFDDLMPHRVRCHRNFEWMLHSEYPIAETAGGYEVCGERGRLRIEPVLPLGWEAKTVAGRTVPKADDRPIHALSIRPPWHHKWNVEPSRSPYPDWHALGDKTPLYPANCRYLVVLTASRKDDDTARFELQPIQVEDATGVKLTGRGESAVVLFGSAGKVVDTDGVETDADEAVVRVRSEGVSWAVVRGTRLTWRGRTLLASDSPVSRTGECNV